MPDKLKLLLDSGQPLRIVASGVAKRSEKKFRRRLGFGGKNQFVNRQKGAETMVIVVAGYKPKLWKHTVPRLAKFIPPEVDVCYATPGKDLPEIREIAGQHGWSYLATRDNRIAQAQNLAIVHHPDAQWIYKIDEDIFLTEGTLSGMREAYDLAKEEGKIDPGYVCPLLNVNGHTYTIMLEKLGLEEEYLARFGETRSACMGVKMHSEEEPAPWMWERTTPLDEIADQLLGDEMVYSVIPHRFSIGAMALERSFWGQMGGFQASLIEGQIGFHEKLLCEYCASASRPGIIARSAFAGHFSFYTQVVIMEKLLEERPELFATTAV